MSIFPAPSKIIHKDDPLSAAEALPSFRTPKDTRAGKGTCNLLAPPPRGGSTPVSPLTVRPLGGVADACFVCESRGRWNLPNGPFPFGAHRDRVQAMLREYVRFNATKRERTRRNAMMREDVRLIVDSRVDRERSHKFAVSFDGKICVVRVREQPVPSQHCLLTRLRLDGILLCEAHGRCRDVARMGSTAV